MFSKVLVISISLKNENILFFQNVFYEDCIYLIFTPFPMLTPFMSLSTPYEIDDFYFHKFSLSLALHIRSISILLSPFSVAHSFMSLGMTTGAE